ncbi:hypothetical protein [Leucobacter sp. W1038]|uniref:hypothetical protein n=1 Tax=Leucobacter sp. W1038 TaxID=3438281 RepID=UPI003D97F335
MWTVGTIAGLAVFFVYVGTNYAGPLIADVPSVTDEGPAASQPDTSGSDRDSGIPPGFEDTGAGVAIRFVADPVCELGRCSQIEAIALRDCRNALYVEANVLNAAGTIVGYTNDLLGSVRKGEKAVLTLNAFSDTGTRIELTDVSCY